MLFILALLCSLFGVPVVFMDLGVHPSSVLIAHSILFLGALAGGLALSCALWMRPPRSLWLYAYTDGVAVGSVDTIEHTIIRWDDVTDLRAVWSTRFNPVSEALEPRLTAYQLSVYDGRSVAIPSTMRNRLDPYPDVGRLIRALVPPSVAQTIPQFPGIDDLLQPHLTQHGPPR